MSLLHDFARVSRSRSCPICERPDWCLVSRDDEASPSKVICARVESRCRFGQAGWLHVLRSDEARKTAERAIRLPLPSRAHPRFALLADQFERSLDDNCRAELGQRLAVASGSLRRLGTGWTGRAWSFPMRDASGTVVGIALRARDGSKFAVKGSQLGLFVPRDLELAARLVICEGQTDTAAMLDLGFAAVGRPGCRSTIASCIAMAKRLAVAQVVVVADADDVGRAGAAELAAALAVTCQDVREVHPPEGTKDVRDWKKRGATREDVLAAVETARPRRLAVRVRATGGGS